MASSRPYNITTKEVVGKTVVAEDHVSVKLDIPPVASRERTASLLSDALKERRFTEKEDGNLVRERDGVTVSVDPDDDGGPTVTVTAQAEKTLPPPSNPSPCTCRITERLREEQSAQNDLQRQVTARLEGVIGRLGCEIEGVIHKVTAEALKEKARQLGEIKHVSEDVRTGSMTIVVEI